MEKIEKTYKLTYFEKITTLIVLSFIFFPWLSFGLNDLDTQPWVLITNFLFISIYSGRKLKKFLFIGYILLMLIFLIAFIDFGDNSIRGFLTYVVLFSTLHVLYIVFNKFFNYFSSLLPKFNIIWLMAGISQLVFGREILSFLVSVRTSVDRGVTGLAPEPTHYAFFLMFLSWLILLISNNKPSKASLILIFVNIIFILFVAKSSMVFFYCILFAVYIVFSYSNLKQILKIAPLVIILIYIFTVFMLSNTDSRIKLVVSSVLSNPMYVIENDASINSRVSAPVLSIYLSLKDFFIPHGFNSYKESAIKANQELGMLFWYGYDGDKIMSGTGSLLYELGWIGITIIFLSYFIMVGSTLNYRNTLIPFILLWVFLIGSIPMSFTLICSIIVAYHFINSYPPSKNVYRYV